MANLSKFAPPSEHQQPKFQSEEDLPFPSHQHCPDQLDFAPKSGRLDPKKHSISTLCSQNKDEAEISQRPFACSEIVTNSLSFHLVSHIFSFPSFFSTHSLAFCCWKQFLSGVIEIMIQKDFDADLSRKRE